MIIIGILVGIVVIVFGVSFIRFVMDDFGEYNCLKSYRNYIRETLEFPGEVLMSLLKRTKVKTSDGVLYNPEERPEDFFKSKEAVIFFNIEKISPYYHKNMGLAIRELPQGLVKGIVKPNRDDDEHSTVRVEFDGEKELQIYCDSPLLMHKWELPHIQKSTLLRRIYLIGACETIGGLNEAIKRAPFVALST